MVPIKGDWTPFKDFQDQLEHYRLWGLIPEKGKHLRPIMVTDGYFGKPEPCKVVGYQTDTWAVIELPDGCHAIYGEYLAELQPDACQRLPRNMCFVDILQKYILFDIETTGFDIHRDRIIEIAAVTYEYGTKVSEFHSLVNPCCFIPSDITALTGITQQDVDSAPTLDQITSVFQQYVSNLPMIGHNAVTFDVPFLKAQGCEFDNIVIDTLPMARKAFPQLSHHTLEYLKNTLELSNGVSHRAMQDVETTHALLWACMSPRKYESKVWHAYLDERMSVAHQPAKKQKDKRSKQNSRVSKFEKVDLKSIVPTCDFINCNSPLFGKNIVFTGTLSMPREEAMQLAVNAGAILKPNVSKTTHYLVVGRQDLTLVGSDGMSLKEERAHELNRSGKCNINIIFEQEFQALLNEEASPSAEQQVSFFADSVSESWVFETLKEALLQAVARNNASAGKLCLKEGKSYSSVWYDSQLAFRLCCRDNHHYFGISTLYTHCANSQINTHITSDGKSDGFVNYAFTPSVDGISQFKEFLSMVLDTAIDSIPKEFDCCSRFEECSNAMKCTHPNSEFSVKCGYRKVMKKGHIYYGPNRNID